MLIGYRLHVNGEAITRRGRATVSMAVERVKVRRGKVRLDHSPYMCHARERKALERQVY
jgi:hypothetical protein